MSAQDEPIVAASIKSFDDIRDEIAAFCARWGLPDRTGFSLTLVLEELVVNVVDYGYEGKGGPIRLNLSVAGDLVCGELADEGHPFDPTGTAEVDVNEPMEARAIGGLGVHLVRTMAETFAYERVGDTNVVRFTLRVAADEHGGEEN